MKIDDKRKNNGGNKNAGRKPKVEEQKLIETLTPLDPLAQKQLKKAMEEGEKWAIELYYKYRYGMPKQQTDITTNGNDINISPIEWVE